MKYELDQMVQRGHAFAIVDEVDSILVDEARTPLIISGPSDDKSDLYNSIDKLIPRLVQGDYDVDEKQRTANLTEAGNEHIETLLAEAGLLTEGSLYEAANATLVHHVQQGLKAHKLFARDKDYIVRNGEVVIIDEFSGRMMPGRRYSEGLHQALEAKEGVTVQPENVTLASITFQNYFRLYKKLAGMTGTAATEADEFAEIYKLDVVEIPTNRAVSATTKTTRSIAPAREKLDRHRQGGRDCQRQDAAAAGRHDVDREIGAARRHAGRGRVQAHRLHGSLGSRQGLYKAARANDGKPSKLFAILNARFHEQEAYIVAEAGVPGAITIATNMAGRGTDIQLGGSVDMRIAQECVGLEPGEERAAKEAEIRAEVEMFKRQAITAGGLYIVGTERHESRRIDNQLRGRAGRQGDPGRSKFFLSLQDDLMRIFGSERMDMVLKRLGLQEGEAIVHPWINKALEKAQQKVEARNFDMRKNILKYDDVMNDQRRVVFEQRRDMMGQESLEETIGEMRTGVVDDLVARFMPHDAYPEAWDIAGLKEALRDGLNVEPPVEDWAREEGIADEEMRERLNKAIDQAYTGRVETNGPDLIALRREADRPAGAGPPVARASRRARPSAAGHRLARHGATRPAERIQVRSFRSLRRADHQTPRGRDGPADAGRSCLRSVRRQPGTATHVRHPCRPPDRGRRHGGGRHECAPVGWGFRRWWRHDHHGALGRDCADVPRSGGAVELGQGRAQRGLSLRFRQEIQALPRRARLKASRAIETL